MTDHLDDAGPTRVPRHRTAHPVPSAVADHDHLARPDPPDYCGVPSLIPGKHESAPTLGSGSARSSSRKSGSVMRDVSLAGECVPEPPEDAATVLLHRDLGPRFIAELGQLA